MSFLRRLDPRYRGVTAKHFLKPIRSEGLTNPSQIVNHVRDQAKQRAERGDRVAENLLYNLTGHPDEALHCADYYVKYERLTMNEKVQRERQLKTKVDPCHIANNPPTPS